jgi:hypothetical protein
MCDREEEHHKDYSATFDCIEQLLKKSNERFHLPLRDGPLTLEQVTIHLDEAAKHLRQCQKDSIELQFKSHNNLLAKYNTNTNPLTQKASEKKASAV